MEVKKYTQKKCPHGRRESRCVDCGGSATCEHKRIKIQCKDCGGSQICKHNQVKSRCKECGGSAICEHGIFKTGCKQCGGSSICQHGIHKYGCKECGGSAICEHGKHKPTCKECGGSSICEHNKHKSICKKCGGSAICEHGIQKSGCKECGGSRICQHGKHKPICKECGGSAICEHNRKRADCKECGGSNICKHHKLKKSCKECDGYALCKSSWCHTTGITKYNGYCLNCCIHLCPEIEVSRNYKTKENDVVSRIKQHFPNFDWIADKRIQDGCSKRRPDLLLDLGTQIIIVEVDENKHNDYDCSCEHKRLMELSQDVGHRPIIFIRFNPDDYTDINGNKIKSCWKQNKLGIMCIAKNKQTEWEERYNILNQQIQYWIDNTNEKMVEIVELFY